VKKLRIGVIYGGRSGEHEVSLASAAAVFKNLDPQRYEGVPVKIEKDGRWTLPSRPPALASAADVIARREEIAEPANETHLVAHPGRDTLISLDFTAPLPIASGISLDVVFPVLHGPYGEDGTVQGLLELANVPYVGAGVLASALGMDKAAMKMVFAARGLPICDYVVLTHREWRRDERSAMHTVVNRLGFPVFVKPANLGSSVGVQKVKEAGDLTAALENAFHYDVKVLVEVAVDAREIELSVLENPDSGADPLVSVPGEIEVNHEFYSYEAKYLDEKGAALIIPAKLDGDRIRRVQDIARKAFLAMECEGMARVDLLLDRTSDKLFFNELNTIPGFTSISMYPKLWEASGIGYTELLSRLVDLAISRHKRKKALVREFHI
jgi:D-alanine-D-alanine ligase